MEPHDGTRDWCSFAPIPALIFNSGPTAVAWLIVAVIVDSIDAVLLARFAVHVFQEILERVAPTFADRNAATAIMFEASSIWIRAALDHCLPRMVLSGAFGADSMTVDGYCLAVQTAAASGIATCKTCPDNDRFMTAVAASVPVRITAFVCKV